MTPFLWVNPKNVENETFAEVKNFFEILFLIRLPKLHFAETKRSWYSMASPRKIWENLSFLLDGNASICFIALASTQNHFIQHTSRVVLLFWFDREFSENWVSDVQIILCSKASPWQILFDERLSQS